MTQDSEGNLIIGVWGDYGRGNFGDDLMALQFASLIESHNATPLVHGLDVNLARRHGLSRTSDVDELCRRADAIMIGGGGFLARRRWPQRILNALRRQGPWRSFIELEKLARAVTHHRVPVAAVSIGGDGDTRATFDTEEDRIWRDLNLDLVTVRLPADRAILGRSGYAARYYPDVVLDLRSALPVPAQFQRDVGTFRVGVNIKRRHRWPLVWMLDWIARAASRSGIHIEFLTFPTHLAGYVQPYELTRSDATGRWRTHKYDGPLDLIQALSELDLVISGKLHVGVAALAVGTPFISFGGPPKARAFLRMLNADDWSYASWNIVDMVRHVRDLALDRRAGELERLQATVETAAAQSAPHGREVVGWVKSLTAQA